jgi:hypothetical protein
VKKISLFCNIVFFSSSLLAQKPVTQLEQWVAKSPIEKVYLHFDRTTYMAGETAWFKAYLSSDYLPDTISTNLFVELLEDSSTVLTQLVLPVVAGSSNGQIDLPDTLSTGNYFIRAYTATMLNQDPAFIFQHRFTVFGKGKTVPIEAREKKWRIEFFPEGGNFVSGLMNSLAFKITNEYGLPENKNGYIENEKGEKIVDFTSYHDGMGVLDMKPEAGSRYFAKLDADASGSRFELPLHTNTGLVFRMVPDMKGSFYELFFNTESGQKKPAYLIGQMQHRVLFKKPLSFTKNESSGTIDTRTAGSGILQVTVFDENDMPMAERLVFVDNKEYQQVAAITMDTLNFSKRGKNHFTLSFKDAVSGNFSVSIADEDYLAAGKSQQTIISNLLLTSDLKGYIHNPAYYFSATTDSAKNALDLLMMVNGWRRFAWKELLSKPVPAPLYKDNGYLSVSGAIKIRDSKKILPDYELMTAITSTDTTQNRIEIIRTDAEGRFRIDSLILFGRNKFFISDIKGKKSKWLDVYPDTDSFAWRNPLPPLDYSNFGFNKKIINNTSVKLGLDYDALAKEKGEMLEGVTMTVKKKTPLQTLEERYVNGAFGGMARTTIDLVNTEEVIYQQNIFDYIQGRVPGITVMRGGGGYTLNYRNRSSLMGGPIPMTIFLNEVVTDANMVAMIPANQVAMIKVFSTFVGAEGNGAGGVLAIYTKKGDDITSLEAPADIFNYKGYSVVRQFYSPDYKVETDKAIGTDKRITLHWQPMMLLNQKFLQVPLSFYNNDRTTAFRIIAEGMTWDGKMIHIEKVISPNR